MSSSSQTDQTTADQLSNKAREAAEHISNKAGNAKDRIQDEAEEVQAKAMEAGENAKEHYDDTLEAVGAFVRENPLVAIGLAFGAGALLAAMRRKA
ncbi:MAG: hypothetical protein LAT65_13665 [Saccharospirillum sp.]|nr:hypothetical protein [Saccharospirillum sp.]